MIPRIPWGFIVGAALTGFIAQTISERSVEVAFSPKRGGIDLVHRTIDSCRKEMRMATYGFTSVPIAGWVIAAQRRGVDVAIVSDLRANETDLHSEAYSLVAAGVRLRLNGHYPIHHHKFIICDGHTVQTGSFNYTAAAADRNAENVTVLWNAPRAFDSLRIEWQRLWDEAEPWKN